MIVYGVGLSSFSFWVADWIGEFHTPRVSIMYCVMLSYIVGSLVAPFAGAAMERWSFRGVIATGLLFFAIGFAFLPLARTAFQLNVVYGIGVGSALALCGPVAAQTLVVKWFSRQRGLALGVVLTGSTLGGMLMPPLVTLLLYRIDWRMVSLLVAAVGLIAIPVVWSLIRSPPIRIGSAGTVATQGSRREGGADDIRWTTMEILSCRNFWAMALTFLPICMTFQAINANYSLLLADVGVPAQMAAFFYSFMGMCSVLGKPIIGRLSDRYDHRVLLPIGGLLMGSGYLLVLLGDHPGFIRMVVGSILMSTSSAFFFPMQGAIIGRYFGPQSFGRIIGLLNLFFLFAALGPPIAGFIRDQLGSYRVFVIGAAAFPILMMPFIFWLKPRAAATAERQEQQ